MESNVSSHSRTIHQRKRQPRDLDHPRTSINPVKKRRRDLQRLLNHSRTIPADVRIGYERELATCNDDLEAAKIEARRSHMIRKYHMVRFFERKKATRALKKMQQALAGADSTGDLRGLKARVQLAEVDLNYTLYYPLDQAYTSLYAGKKEKEKDNDQDQGQGEETTTRTNPMWKIVEDAMVEEKLPELRDGKYNFHKSKAIENPSRNGDAGESAEQSSKLAPTSHKSNHARKKPERSKVPDAPAKEGESDKEDGGGFFES